MAKRFLVGVAGSVFIFFIFQYASIYRDFTYLDAQRTQLEEQLLTKRHKADEVHLQLRRKEMEITRLERRMKDLERISSVRKKLLIENAKQDGESSKMPYVYVITPTVFRMTQRADLTRLAQTLMHVPRLHWVVVEDAEKPSFKLNDFLKSFDLRMSHLAARTPPQYRLNASDPRWTKPRGVAQRNLGLLWMRRNIGVVDHGTAPIVYFADDDNTYHVKIFEEMRKIKKVGVWPVGISAKFAVERPLVKDGKVTGFIGWKTERLFPMDMAGFAVNFRLIYKLNPKFSYDVDRGMLESHFLQQMVVRDDLEPLANNCTKVLVWHTQTVNPRMDNELKLRAKGVRSDTGLDV